MNNYESNTDMPSKIKVVAPIWPKPRIEWPTIFLFLIIITILVASTFSALQLPTLYWPIFIIINALGIYSIFTVMHEACHRNISRPFAVVEYVMGFVCGLLYHASDDQFVLLHLKHHAKVNIQGEDPDLLAQGPLTLLKVLSWPFASLSYLKFYYGGKMTVRLSHWRALGP